MLSLVVSATFTAQPLEPVLAYWLRTVGLPAACRFAPTNQVIQQLLDPRSNLSGNAGGVNVLLIRPHDWSASRAGEADRASMAPAEVADHFVDALRARALASDASWIVVTCPPAPETTPVADARPLWEGVDARIRQELDALPGVHVVNGEAAFQALGLDTYHDADSDRLGDIPYTRQGFAALATAVARTVHALLVPPRKVIVLDCDRTLWCGVCGEDPPAALGIGAPRRFLQEFMLAQAKAGALLCLCSKNNEEDVWRVFAERTDMVLSRESLVAWRINWRPKSGNLRALAEELQLGLDTFIFVDDDARECAEVRAQLPEVLTIELPADPGQIPDLLRRNWAFDRLRVTAEDRERTQQYQRRSERDRLRREVQSLDDFVRLLDVRVQMTPAADGDLSRIAQLTHRTTQFNCTLRRRSEGELRALCQRPDAELLSVRATDRLGDYGLIGAVLLDRRGDELHADTLLLSCRALGRGVEQRMMTGIEERAQARGACAVVIPFVAGARNRVAQAFLESLAPRWHRHDRHDGTCEYRLASQAGLQE